MAGESHTGARGIDVDAQGLYAIIERHLCFDLRGQRSVCSRALRFVGALGDDFADLSSGLARAGSVDGTS